MCVLCWRFKDTISIFFHSIWQFNLLDNFVVVDTLSYSRNKQIVFQIKLCLKVLTKLMTFDDRWSCIFILAERNRILVINGKIRNKTFGNDQTRSCRLVCCTKSYWPQQLCVWKNGYVKFFLLRQKIRLKKGTFYLERLIKKKKKGCFRIFRRQEW